MRHRNVPVHIEIPGRLWDLDGQSIHFFRDGDLAAQPTRFRQSEGHVQHVFLVLRGFFQRLEYVPVRKYHVTGAASANALAGTLQLDIVPLGYLKQGLSHVRIGVGLDGFPIAVHKRHVNGMGVVVVDVGTAVPSFGKIVVVVIVLDRVDVAVVHYFWFHNETTSRMILLLLLHRRARYYPGWQRRCVVISSTRTMNCWWQLLRMQMRILPKFVWRSSSCSCCSIIAIITIDSFPLCRWYPSESYHRRCCNGSGNGRRSCRCHCCYCWDFSKQHIFCWLTWLKLGLSNWLPNLLLFVGWSKFSNERNMDLPRCTLVR